jgi:antitoxin ParD1/3/4
VETRREKDLISADFGQHFEEYVAHLVANGRYGSKSEVLREGVRLVEDREAALAVLDAIVAPAIR